MVTATFNGYGVWLRRLYQSANSLKLFHDLTCRLFDSLLKTRGNF